MRSSTQALPRWSEAAAAPTDASRATRHAWVDTARGIGMVLVVLGHALGGLIDAGLLSARGASGAVFHGIYTFHMPLFFLLSGLFVRARMERGAMAFLRGSVPRLAWAYALWSVVTLVIVDAMGSWVNRPASLHLDRLVALLWDPTSQFWFLHALLVLQIASALLLPRAGARAALVLSAAAWLVAQFADLPVSVERPMRFGVFFFIGVAYGPAILDAARALRAWRAGMLAGACALVAACAAAVSYLGHWGYWSAGSWPAAAAGTAAVLLLSRALPAVASGALEHIGRHTMAVFVLHVLFVAGTRIALHKGLGVSEAAWVLPLIVASGMAGPLLVRAAADRLNATRRLGLS